MKRGKKLLILLLALILVGCAILAVEKIIEANIVYMTDKSIPVVSIDTENLKEIICTYQGETLTLRKDGDSWIYVEDPSNVPESSVMDEALNALSDVRADKILENAQDMAEYGLAGETLGSVTAVTDTQTVVLQIGKETAFQEQHYVSIGDGNVYIISDLKFLNRIPMVVSELQEPTITSST